MIGRSCARCRASFLLTPLREGRRAALYAEEGAYTISTHAPAGGATINAPVPVPTFYISTHAPAGGATRRRRRLHTDAADFYSRPCGRGDRGGRTSRDTRPGFLLTPLREGRRTIDGGLCEECRFLLTPLREGRPASGTISVHVSLFLLTPLREGRRVRNGERGCAPLDFYSRPCGRGDKIVIVYGRGKSTISTHAPAGGATAVGLPLASTALFLLTPLREGRRSRRRTIRNRNIFLLTPLREGRQLVASQARENVMRFLLTPLREGRRSGSRPAQSPRYFYSRPCGRGDQAVRRCRATTANFYSRPCGRGDVCGGRDMERLTNFYSRPCGRGDVAESAQQRFPRLISTHAPAGGATLHIKSDYANIDTFLLTPLREGRLFCDCEVITVGEISTHAPAGGATIIPKR